jgi:hypothetical protein
MTQTIKRHLVSFLVTFGATFILTLIPAIEQNAWDTSLMLSIVIAAARSAFKLAYEFAIIPLLNILIEWARKIKG